MRSQSKSLIPYCTVAIQQTAAKAHPDVTAIWGRHNVVKRRLRCDSPQQITYFVETLNGSLLQRIAIPDFYYSGSLDFQYEKISI